MSDNLSPTEERAIDVLLSEACGAKEAPDLMGEIIARLDQRPAAESHFVAPVVDASAARRKRKTSGRRVWAPLMIAVAASMLLAVWIGQAGRQAIKAPEVAQGTPPQPPNDFVPRSDVRTDDQPAAEPPVAPTTRLAVDETLPPAPSIVPEVEFSSDDMPTHDFEPALVPSPATGPGRGLASSGDAGSSDDSVARPRKPIVERRPVQLVSRRVDEGLRDYWKGLGVRPTGEAKAEIVAGRVESALGVAVPSRVLTDIEQLKSLLARPSSAKAIAASWLDGLTMNGFRRMNGSDREHLLTPLSDAIVAGEGFDRVIAGFISGKGTGGESASEAWYKALGSHGEPAMRNRLAAVTMNADLRCTRCHDAKVSSQGRQQDYWSFAAVIRSRVQPQSDGGWKLEPVSPKRSNVKPIFYDLLDGRRQFAQAGVPPQWMGPEWTEPTSSVRDWSEDLVGSRAIAKGIVNTLWSTLLGRPLVGSPVDGVASPPDESLLQLQHELCDDLIASEFDVARTLALIIRSAAMRRNVPEVLTSQNSLLASRQQLSDAELLVSAFAAAAPERRRVVMHRKIAFVLRAAGLSIDPSIDHSSVILSQADEPQSRPPSNKRRGNQRRAGDLPEDFPAGGDELPVQWLDSLSDFDAKVEHLAYLSGRSRLPISISVTLDAMRQADADETLKLQRLWWALKN